MKIEGKNLKVLKTFDDTPKKDKKRKQPSNKLVPKQKIHK